MLKVRLLEFCTQFVSSVMKKTVRSVFFHVINIRLKAKGLFTDVSSALRIRRRAHISCSSKKKKNDPLKEKRVPEVSFLGRWDDKLRGVVRALSAPPHLTVPAFLDRRAGAEMRPMAPF